MKKSGNTFDNYKPTDSQEQILQNCCFAGQSEFLSGGVQSSSDDSELLHTGIMMVSVSESSQEDYKTPPEHNSRSQNSPLHVDMELKCDGVPDLETNDEPRGHNNIVDLTNDSEHDDLGLTEVAYVVADDDVVETEAFETQPVENADKVLEQMPKRGDVNGKRKLPFTIESKHQTCQDSKGNEAFTGVMDRVLSLLPKHDDDDADIDLIETAKMRGMTFPRPRWWPPQGFK